MKWIGETKSFIVFSSEHFYMLAGLLILILILIINKRKIKKSHVFLTMILGLCMYAQEVLYNLWQAHNNIWTIGESLPFHLCGLCVLIGPILYLTKNQKLFDCMYYWSIGAAVALFMPDIGAYGLPSFRFFQFFISHGLILIEVVLMLVVFNMRPSRHSVKHVMIITNIIMALVGIFNYAFDGNYFYIAHKPETASIIDFLGPWPVYILAMEAIALILFILMYLPFRKHQFKRKEIIMYQSRVG